MRTQTLAAPGGALVITEADFDRLSHLVESPRYRATHAALLWPLKEGLGRGQVVPPERVPRHVVTMHSTVRVKDLSGGSTETYTLVYPEEAAIDEGKLSVLAPLGVALLGSRVGQVLRFEAPRGERRLKVLKVLYQPEAAGHFHL